MLIKKVDIVYFEIADHRVNGEEGAPTSITYCFYVPSKGKLVSYRQGLPSAEPHVVESGLLIDLAKLVESGDTPTHEGQVFQHINKRQVDTQCINNILRYISQRDCAMGKLEIGMGNLTQRLTS